MTEQGDTRHELVLSLFPGLGLLDYAFEREGFTVVRGPDVIWGGDIRRFHPPPGRFDGIIGGDPCQSHSSLANLVRANGLEPSFPDMTPEYERVVNEARPAWFLRENVPRAPDVKPDGYDVRSFLLDNSTLDSGDGWGNEQMRRRRWWFGVRDGECPELRRWIDFALFELPDAATTVQGACTGGVQGEALQRRATVRDRAGDIGPGMTPGTPSTQYRKRSVTQWPVNNDPERKQRVQAVAGDARCVPVAVGGSGQRKVTAVAGEHGTRDPKSRSLEEMLRLQGMPEDHLAHQPWTMSAKRKMVGNGVAVPMGRALARAILRTARSSELTVAE